MIRIGAGAGFSGDRLEPAVLLAEKANLDYLVLECLAERTIALAQKRKKQNPSLGYDPLLESRMELLLPVLVKNKVRLITNMGAANPEGAAKKILELAEKQGLSVKVAAVTGDDVLTCLNTEEKSMETGEPLSSFGELISANAYLGADAILPALETGANIIVTGRVADPSLFVAPMAHEFGWSLEDTDRIAQGTAIGHLLECGGQLCGGYFADPGKKDVPHMENLGFPFAEIQPDGTTIIKKLDGTGGIISLATAKEQLLYEVTNPYQYITPDVKANFTTLKLEEIAPNQIKVSSCTGMSRPETLKVSAGYHAGYIGEGEISYAGPNALGRAQLAGEILHKRLKNHVDELRIDYIGSTSVHRTMFGTYEQPYEIRLRAAGRAATEDIAAKVGEEVEALYTNGPAGGGGARKYTNEVIGIISALIPRNKVKPSVTVKECAGNEAKII